MTKSLLVVLLLLASCNTLSNYTYNFNTNNFAPYITPSYPLGQLTINNSLDVNITFPATLNLGISPVIFNLVDTATQTTVVT
jgi:hypothetical protein